MNKYKQIGNAVPVSVGEAIGKLILTLTKDEEAEEIPNFKYSRYLNTSDKSFIDDFQKRARKFIEETESSQLSLF